MGIRGWSRIEGWEEGFIVLYAGDSLGAREGRRDRGLGWGRKWVNGGGLGLCQHTRIVRAVVGYRSGEFGQFIRRHSAAIPVPGRVGLAGGEGVDPDGHGSRRRERDWSRDGRRVGRCKCG